MALKRHRHYGTHAVVAFLLINIILTPLSAAELIPTGVYIGLLSFCLFAWVTRIRHNLGYLCDECIASMPLVPQKRADELKPVLWAMHFLNGRPYRALGLSVCVLVLSIVGAALLYTDHAVPYVIVQELVLLYLLSDVTSQHVHGKYRPWCPYCNGGGGGGHAHADSPDPTIPQPA